MQVPLIAPLRLGVRTPDRTYPGAPSTIFKQKALQDCEADCFLKLRHLFLTLHKFCFHGSHQILLELRQSSINKGVRSHTHWREVVIAVLVRAELQIIYLLRTCWQPQIGLSMSRH